MKFLRNLLAILAVIQIAIPAGAQIGTGVSIPQVAARFIYSSGSVINPPLTTLPQPSFVAMDINPDTVSQTDGTEVTSISDTTNSITCTAPAGSGPTIKNAISQANGHNVLRTTVSTKYLNCGRPASLATAMSSLAGWSMIAVFRNPGNTDTVYSAIVGDIINNGSGGFSFTVGSGRVNQNAKDIVSGKAYSPGDPATNIHTVGYSGDAGYDVALTNGRMFLDGTMWWGTRPLKQSQNAADNITLFSASNNAGTFSPVWGYVGDLVRVIAWSKPLTAAEMWQADAWARVTYGKTLATQGLSYFLVFDGDSQTMGTGAGSDSNSNLNTRPFADNSMPWLVAQAKGLSLGQYANVGKPSAKTKPVASGGANNNITDSAVRDVDQWHAVTGLPIVLVVGEYYNEAGGCCGVTATGVTQANLNRAYATARKTADATIKIIMWTSLSSCNRDGTTGSAREGFNNSLISTPGNIDVVVPLHTETNIGVYGSINVCTPSTYSPDGIHLNGQVGYPAMRDFLLPYVHQ